mgnify:CR=1 FL=1
MRVHLSLKVTPAQALSQSSQCLRAYPACASCQDRYAPPSHSPQPQLSSKDRGETCYWNDDDPPPAPRRNQVRRPTTFDASPLAAELHALGEQVQDLVDRVNRIDKARAQATMSYRPPSPDSPNALPFPQPASSATHHPPQSTSSSHPQEQRPPPHPWAQRASPHLQHPCPPAHNSPTPSLHTFVPALHLEQPRTFLHQPTSQGRYYQAPRFVEEARLRQAGGWGGAAG